MSSTTSKRLISNFKNNPTRFLRAVLLGLVISSTICRAGPYDEAATAFAKGDFTAAVQGYEAALAAGDRSAGLYENLAMAQMKAGQRPQAALSLQRAILLDPRGIDARMALSDLDRSLGVPPGSSGWREAVAERVPLLPLVIVGCGVMWLGAFLFLSMGIRVQAKFWLMAGGAFCLLGGAGLAAVGFLSDPRWVLRDAAVVLSDDGLKLLSAPADQSETMVSLPGGATVQVLRRSGAWIYARSLDGKTGWTVTPSLEAVVPSS